MSHTPTPYWVDEENPHKVMSERCPVVTTDDGSCFNTPEEAKLHNAVSEEGRATAAFIVRACNAHDALVKRLEIAVEQMEAHPGLFDPITMRCHRLALAKAEGK